MLYFQWHFEKDIWKAHFRTTITTIKKTEKMNSMLRGFFYSFFLSKHFLVFQFNMQRKMKVSHFFEKICVWNSQFICICFSTRFTKLKQLHKAAQNSNYGSTNGLNLADHLLTVRCVLETCPKKRHSADTSSTEMSHFTFN